ncbi:MAG: xanthine dehydrogenase family protein subunit M [Acidimicrobiaceae bacterium]|nr:xanthine dehydrogenase family protein subunit M [Acidimicrobiaceae bacterium]
MKAAPFAYATAETLDEAVALLADAGEDAKLLAGGQSLLPLLAFRLARPSHIIDIGGVKGLESIDEDPGGLRVSALVRHATLEQADLDGPWNALREAASLIGHLPIRVRGTFGGSLAHADPAGELGVVVAALDAEIALKSPRGLRTVPASEFFLAPLTTAAGADEVLVEARFPAPGIGFRSVFEEFSPRVGDFAYASVAAGCRLEDDGSAHDVRIALGSVGPTPVRAHQAEQALSGSTLQDDAIGQCARLAAGACDPAAGDWHADGSYRRALVAQLVERALKRLRRPA